MGESVRLRKRSLLAALLATSALVLLLRAGHGEAVMGWAGAFLAGPQPVRTVQTKMAVKTEDNDANMQKAAEMRAAFLARQEEERKTFPDMDKRGFLGQLRPGKKPSVLDIIADPDLAYDDRFPKTAAMEAAIARKTDFDQRNPQLGPNAEGQTYSGPYGGSIWPISGEIAVAPAPQLSAKAAPKLAGAEAETKAAPVADQE